MVLQKVSHSGWSVLVAALALLVLYSLARGPYRRGLRSIPGPYLARYSSIFRILLVRNGDAPSRYLELHKRYGPIVRTGPNHVSVSDPGMIPVIYGIGKRFDKTSFYKILAPVYEGRRMDSMFTERDPLVHRALKGSVAQLFSMTNMRNFEVYADECTKIFIDAMENLEGQSVDFAAWLQWYAFDVIGSITFQRRFDFMEKRKDVDSMIQKINEGLEYVKLIGQSEWLIALFDVLSRSDWITHSNLWPDTMERFFQITEAELARYDGDRKDNTRTDFLSQLRANQEKSGKISHRDMINHLSNNLLAGSDTTAISLRALFYFLTKCPLAMKKVVSEIDEADQLGNLSELITYKECLQLPYFQAAMKEAMRMHPAVGFPLERYVPPEGAEICGYLLPAGTNVSISAPVIHMNQDIFGNDAAEYRPERWLEASPERLREMDRCFLAFGHGSRTCIGKNISIMEMGKFVPQILRYFEIQWASEDPEWHTYAAWFWKQSNLHVKLRSRKRRGRK